jgi:CHAT domain-containing protein
MNKAEALREARTWLRAWTARDGSRPYEHPYYWASFVLVGR